MPVCISRDRTRASHFSAFLLTSEIPTLHIRANTLLPPTTLTEMSRHWKWMKERWRETKQKHAADGEMLWKQTAEHFHPEAGWFGKSDFLFIMCRLLLLPIPLHIILLISSFNPSILTCPLPSLSPPSFQCSNFLQFYVHPPPFLFLLLAIRPSSLLRLKPNLL